jgi:hypothetical protein
MGKSPKKQKEKENILYWDILQLFNYHFGFCPDEKTWVSYWDNLKMKKGVCRPEYPSSFGATTFYDDKDIVSDGINRALVVVNPTHDMTIEMLASIMAHEATHIVQDVAEKIGEEKFSNEVEAYLIQYVTHGLLCMYKEAQNA